MQSPSQVVEKANEQDQSSNCVVYPYTCTSFTQPTTGFDTIQKTLVKASLRSFVSRRTGVQRQTGDCFYLRVCALPTGDSH